jgi:ATP adenylyltransferase/5',5'''-P-1,P-4-tetraphosphate phosphorylase II
VRWCIRQGSEWFKDYVKAVAQARGRAAAQRLLADVKAQATAGNVGAPHEWITVQPRSQAKSKEVA